MDRLSVRAGVGSRLADSLETALRVGEGLVRVAVAGGEEMVLSSRHSCPGCGFSFAEISPRLFSFNSPQGACRTCSGLGFQREVDPDKLVLGSRAVPFGGVPRGSEPGRPLLAPARVGAGRRASRIRPSHALAPPARVREAVHHVRVRRRAGVRLAGAEGGLPLSGPVRRAGEEDRTAIPRERLGGGPAGARAVHVVRALPLMPGAAATTGGAGGQGRRAQHRRGVVPAGSPGAGLVRPARARRQGPGDRPQDPPRGARPAGVPGLRRSRLPDPRPHGEHPLRRGEPAHPPRDPGGLQAHGGPLRPRRALDRPPPAGQPAAPQHPEGDARPRQHRHRGGARRGDHPCGRLGHRPRPGGGLSRRAGGRRRATRGHHGQPGVVDRTVPGGPGGDSRAGAPPGRQRPAVGGAGRGGAQPQGDRRGASRSAV